MSFRHILLLITFFSLPGLNASGPQSNYSVSKPSDPPFLGAGKAWVDSVMKTLSPDQRIGQLFMVAAYSNKPKAHSDEILKLIRENHIGGLIFMQGGPVRQAKLNNIYQQAAKVPLLISIDGEWGVSMRLDSTLKFPKQMTLGAIRNDTLIYRMGAEVARQCLRLGIHVNFAPVVDVNNNPSNPVINMRSFGENKINVAAKGVAYMKGMQDMRVIANAKHFPGHGDTDSDSHKTLPVINHNRARLDSLELYPFRELIRNGIGSMMVAHLFVPALDSTKNTATTLSKKVVTDLLKNEMKFKGLVFTDALNMKGVSSFNKPGFVDVKALLAGNDVLLFAENVPVAITEIKKAVADGSITQADIDERCRRILEAKYWCGLHKNPRVELKNLHADLNPASAKLLIRQLTEASLTVLENREGIIPLKNLDKIKIASLSVGDDVNCKFQKTAGNYAKISRFSISREEIDAKLSITLEKLKDFDVVLVGVHNPKNSMSRNAGINKSISNLVARLNMQGAKVILSVFANPYSLVQLGEDAIPYGLIQAYEDTDDSQDLTAQLIFGAVKANGRLPVSINHRYKFGNGYQLAEVIRLKYTIPEELGINQNELASIDSLAYAAIRLRATPGCQILIARDGKVFHNKSYGFHTYANRRPVLNEDLYDLASITKIAASTLAIMRLQDEGYIDLKKNVGDYLPQMRTSNIGSLQLRDILLHQAGLPAWIPFYKKTVASEQLRNYYYSTTASDSFPLKVADKMYLRKEYEDTLLMLIAAADLDKKKEYKYSDLGYYIFKSIIEKHVGVRLDKYVDSVFYKPLGLARMTYNPLGKFPADEIVPTEKDELFRRQLLQGYVHDQGAAMMGGVAGHAGLFSSASDLAVLMQMLLNKGEYGGVRYISEKTIEEYTKCHNCKSNNRRGLGFDKPEMNYAKTGPTCKCVSASSFGHTGFTGTMAWADPDKNVVYIFLSNRVYPDAENKKLQTLSTRTLVQEAIYHALNTKKP